MSAAEHKSKGNACFAAKEYAQAITHFTDAIKADPKDGVFYSNRSACYASLKRYHEAVSDAKKCVQLRPDWFKAYSRLGQGLLYTGKAAEAVAAYKKGLTFKADDAALLDGLRQAEELVKKSPGGAATSGSSGSSSASAGSPAGKGAGKGGQQGTALTPQAIMIAMATDPACKKLQEDEAFSKLLEKVMSGGIELEAALTEDPRLMDVLGAAQRLQMSGDDGMRKAMHEAQFGKDEPKAKAKKRAASPPPDTRTDGQKAADVKKQEGNELYKARKFDEAVAKYDEAIALEPNDILYYNNKAAVMVEQGKYDEVAEMLTEVLSRRYELNSALPGGASFEKVAKVLVRMGNVRMKQGRMDEAVEFFDKALTEDNNRTVRVARQEAQKKLEKERAAAMIDEAKAEELREEGNVHFKAGSFADATKSYNAALPRAPPGPLRAKILSNRAGALTKLMSLPDALRDCEQAIKEDPTFIKSYIRKAQLHTMLKENHKGLETYSKALLVEPDNAELKQGKQQLVQQIHMMSGEGTGPDQERIQRAMADPEIQRIMGDRQVQMVLEQMQTDPKAAQSALKDPQILDALTKLQAAGIVRLG